MMAWRVYFHVPQGYTTLSFTNDRFSIKGKTIGNLILENRSQILSNMLAIDWSSRSNRL